MFGEMLGEGLFGRVYRAWRVCPAWLSCVMLVDELVGVVEIYITASLHSDRAHYFHLAATINPCGALACT